MWRVFIPEFFWVKRKIKMKLFLPFSLFMKHFFPLPMEGACSKAEYVSYVHWPHGHHWEKARLGNWVQWVICDGFVPTLTSSIPFNSLYHASMCFGRGGIHLVKKILYQAIFSPLPRFSTRGDLTIKLNFRQTWFNSQGSKNQMYGSWAVSENEWNWKT